MGKAAAFVLALTGCYAARFSEGAPCTADSECPGEQHCVANACSLGAGPTSLDAAIDTPATPAATACPALSIFCDNFEAGIAGWSGANSASATVVVGTHAHASSHALDALVPQMAGGGEGDLYVDVPAQSIGVLAVREWVSSPQPLRNSDGVLSLTNNTTYLEVMANDLGMWSVSDFSLSGGLHDHASTQLVPPIDTWTCIELDVTFQPGAPALLELYVDDTLVMKGPGNAPAPAYNRILVGVTRAEAAGTHVYVDDVAIAHQHAGC